MIDVNQLSYTAIITITLPDTPEPAQITLTLAPSDQVLTTGGALLPLRDCTLADLQQYAQQVEQEIAAEYQAIKLMDLANDAGAKVKITLLNESERPLSDDWLQHAIVKQRPAAESTAPASGAPDAGIDQERAGDEPAEIIAPAGEQEAESAAAPEKTESEAAEAPAEEDEVERDDAALAVQTDAPVPDETVASAETGTATEPAAQEVDVASEETPAATVDSEAVAIEREEERPAVRVSRSHRVAGRKLPAGHATWCAADILIDESAFRDAQAHAISSPDREVAGVLVGPPPEKQPDGRYVVRISDTIIAQHTRMQGASVTYTPESWRYLNDQLAERYPDESAVMVGWYHTHPGFGIFLSGMDLFIHQNFFTQIWHIALVLDPLARKSGFFGWDRQQQRVSAYDFPWPSWAANSW